MRRHRYEPRRLAVYRCDPGQLELSGLYRDQTGFAKELVAILNPDDRRGDAAQYRVHAVQVLDLFFGPRALAYVFTDAGRAYDLSRRAAQDGIVPADQHLVSA